MSAAWEWHPKRGGHYVSRPCPSGLEAAGDHIEDHHHQQDDDQHTQDAAGAVTPLAAVGPLGKTADKKKNEHDEQDESHEISFRGVCG